MSQNQPTAPFHISNLIAPVLDSTIRALSDRPGQTEAQRQVRADGALNLILSFQPRDAVDLTLAGQAVLLNEVLADTARDVLRGPEAGAKVRGLSALLGLGRLTQGHLDRLQKRGNQPLHTEIAAPRTAVGESAADQPRTAEAAKTAEPSPAGEPVQPMPAARTAPAVDPIKPKPTPRTAPAVDPVQPMPVAQTAPAVDPVQPMTTAQTPPEPTEPVYQRPTRPESWLDEPYQEWVSETPALVAATNVATTPTPERVSATVPQQRAELALKSAMRARVQMEVAAAGD